MSWIIFGLYYSSYYWQSTIYLFKTGDKHKCILISDIKFNTLNSKSF